MYAFLHDNYIDFFNWFLALCAHALGISQHHAKQCCVHLHNDFNDAAEHGRQMVLETAKPCGDISAVRSP